MRRILFRWYHQTHLTFFLMRGPSSSLLAESFISSTTPSQSTTTDPMSIVTQRELSLAEANAINDNPSLVELGEPEYDEHGFSLLVGVDGKKYTLYYDHQTWFTGVGYEELG
jgi:hypothetical protein